MLKQLDNIEKELLLLEGLNARKKEAPYSKKSSYKYIKAHKPGVLLLTNLCYDAVPFNLQKTSKFFPGGWVTF